MKRFFCTALGILFVPFLATAQSLLGTDIDGEAGGDNFGFAVSMPDIHTLAVGGYSNGSSAGHVRVFRWNGTAWIQKGADIDGESIPDQSGFALSMPDSNTVAIGAPTNGGNGPTSGHVRVYRWVDTAWVQKGGDIDGEFSTDQSGRSVSMPDSNTVAIGAYYNDGTGPDAGHVRIFRWNGTAWVQKGGDLDGEASGDFCGNAVSMPDSNTVAVGAFLNSGGGVEAGHVRIYSWNGSAWVQKGADIDGEDVNNYSGRSVSMPDANTVAIGAYGNDGSALDAGHVRVFTWSGSAWVQKGGDIEGEAAGDYAGISVDMPDINTVAVGAYLNDGSGTNAGSVRIYHWNGSNWVQRGTDMNGEAANDRSGVSISMPDSNTVAIGAYQNDGTGTDAGHVRVYSFVATRITESIPGTNISVFPNPTKEHITLDLGVVCSDVTVVVRNILGQEINRKTTTLTRQVDLTLDGNAGVYLLEITVGGKTTVIKVVKS